MMERQVLIEVRSTIVKPAHLEAVARKLSQYGFIIDLDYGAIPLGEPLSSYCLRGTVPEDRLPKLKSATDVLAVWDDAQVTPFAGFDTS